MNEEILTPMQKWYKEHPGYYEEHREAYLANIKRYSQRLKVEILTHYGKGNLGCVKCGESRLPCLSLDHMNGGGTQERKKLGGPMNFLRYLRKENFPVGYQTLCMNCQFIKRSEHNENATKRCYKRKG